MLFSPLLCSNKNLPQDIFLLPLQRNYIRKAINSNAKMSEWHRLAYDRYMRKYGPKKGKVAALKESKYMTERRKVRMENIKKVKDLRKKGWNTRAIANEIGVSDCTVLNYLKS